MAIPILFYYCYMFFLPHKLSIQFSLNMLIGPAAFGPMLHYWEGGII
jgi:hypothetical protein